MFLSYSSILRKTVRKVGLVSIVRKSLILKTSFSSIYGSLANTLKFSALNATYRSLGKTSECTLASSTILLIWWTKPARRSSKTWKTKCRKVPKRRKSYKRLRNSITLWTCPMSIFKTKCCISRSNWWEWIKRIETLKGLLLIWTSRLEFWKSRIWFRRILVRKSWLSSRQCSGRWLWVQNSKWWMGRIWQTGRNLENLTVNGA